MAKKISELNPLTGGNIATDDKFVMVDQSGNETKRADVSEVQTAIGVSGRVIDKAATFTAVLGDRSDIFRSTASLTIDLTAAATLGDGWFIDVLATVGTITIDPFGAETIDGAATLAVTVGNSQRISCNGTTFFSVFLAAGDMLNANNLANLANKATSRSNLGVAIGSDVQAFDAGNITSGDNGDKTVAKINLLDYGEITNAIGSIGGGTQNIDLELGNVVTGTVDTSTTTFTFSNPTASDEGCSFTIHLTNGGSQTVNWPASVDWAGGTAPTLTAAGRDVLEFFTTDGGVIWNGFAAGLDMK